VEPIPPELRKVGWNDLFAMMVTFNLSPLVYVLGAIVVVEGGLPLVPVALVLAGIQAVLAVIGFDLLRHFVRVMLPSWSCSPGRSSSST
jgi:hypothetical protein